MADRIGRDADADAMAPPKGAGSQPLGINYSHQKLLDAIIAMLAT